MQKLWNNEFSWNLYRNPWPGRPNWAIIGLLADWTASTDDYGDLFPIEYIPTRRA